METIRNWLLPVLLAAGQAAFLLSRDQPAPLAVVLAAVVAQSVALGWRRRAPVRALAGALGASLLGQLAVSEDFAGTGVEVALYSVAARSSTPVTLRVVAVVIGVDWLLGTARIGFHATLPTSLAVSALVYVVCAGLGVARRQWLTRRLAAARRLAGAEETRRRAADTERHRLAHELHDVSAHHLTSVVVTVDAARRLAGSRPELAAEALEFAERTGRETLTAIQRLVAVMRDADRPDPRPMTGRIQELVAGFGRLGRPIATDLPGDLAGPAAEAAFGIVREALTNALRYAPGAAVRIGVRREEGALELSVDNDAPRAPERDGGTGLGLGSGRGVAGMRERAAAVGGELTAGPAPGGGWRVRATLPDATGPRPPAVRSRRRDFPREQRLTDAALAFTAAVIPLVFAFTAVEEWQGRGVGARAAAVAVLSALTALHAAPLLWRRRAPWAALAGVLATAWLWPLARATGAVPGQLAVYLAGGVLTEVLAVYAAGAYGRGAGRTWPAGFVAAGGIAAALTATAAADGSLSGEAPSWRGVALIVAVVGVLACPFLLLVWGAGLIVRGRRLRALAREDSAVADSVWQATAAAETERRRLAAGLREAVLHRTAALVELARRGRLDEVAAEARSALAAMRELLHSLGDAEPPGRPVVPPRADLDALCRELRAAGRDVRLRGLRGLRGLPGAAVELPAPLAQSAYRVVEAALGAGDRGPARVTLRRRRGALHITVTGVRLAVAGPAAERLREQTASAGGRVTLDLAGTVRVSLPSGPLAAPVQEVSPSPYA